MKEALNLISVNAIGDDEKPEVNSDRYDCSDCACETPSSVRNAQKTTMVLEPKPVITVDCAGGDCACEIPKNNAGSSEGMIAQATISLLRE